MHTTPHLRSASTCYTCHRSRVFLQEEERCLTSVAGSLSAVQQVVTAFGADANLVISADINTVILFTLRMLCTACLADQEGA